MADQQIKLIKRKHINFILILIHFIQRSSQFVYRTVHRIFFECNFRDILRKVFKLYRSRLEYNGFF